MESSKKNKQRAAILKARENRYNEALSINESFPVIAVVHANVAGADKHPDFIYALVNFYKNKMKSFAPKQMIKRDNADGPYRVLAFDDLDVGSLKTAAEGFETERPAGRLIDIDVFCKGEAIKRETPRPCIICGKPVFDCMRNKRHPLEEIIHAQHTVAHDFLRDELKAIMLESIERELNLSPKFGLVTKTSKGSHPDMDAALMLQSAQAFLDDLADMFFCSLSSDDEKKVFERCRSIGKKAEANMVAASGGVNCYKGLIFNLGLIMAALGQVLRKGGRFQRIYDQVSDLAVPLENDFSGANDTFGKIAYHRYGMMGARGEAMSGFRSLKHVLSRFTLADDKSLLRALRWLIVNTEDTVLLKRSSTYDRYHLIKERFRQLNLKDPNEVEAWDAYCVNRHLSFGGSADLLVVALFLRRIQTTLF